ncbi:DUF1800 domain-containing protein [Aquincola tertiaricarbonis]|uniref:DUF1800 domain-containing protein n=1 Tax=Aquincola tertiaricarbonis TaxID=391953 RepID=UPI001E3DE75C|nr:DUF1800 domain-containing protein [Aquincola tertiaricarbonis]
MNEVSTTALRRPWFHRGMRWVAVAATAGLVAACGGGGGGSGGGETAVGSGASPAVGADSGPPAGNAPATGGGVAAPGPTGPSVEASYPSGTPTRADAVRFLTQATFGATPADIERVLALGYQGWLDEQFARPGGSLRSSWDAAHAAIQAADATKSAGQREVLDAFYREAVTTDAQLRMRVAFALSEIFVVSFQNDAVTNNTRAVAAYMDMLRGNAFGSYRQVLEGVALHPAMGLYLSHLRNQKENVAAGRVPDENFAREVMQLFSIGLHQLNADGSRKLDGNGAPIATYTHDDIAGLAKVFTGFSYAGPDTHNNRFWGATGYQDPDRLWKPMQGYSQFHSVSEKRFLGAVVPAQGTAQPAASLKAALDTLAAHPNVGPFIGRQLIQRLVTSHPSPAYVGRVSAAFTGSGGDLKATVKAILLDSEARGSAALADPAFGKLREPVLRLTATLRALGATSDSGSWLISNTDDAATALGQTPLRSPSVFNFFRPGYVAPGTLSGAAGMTTPELQLTHESSVAGYANYMRGGVQSGWGMQGLDGKAARRDVQVDLSGEEAVADRPDELVDRVAARLMGAAAPAALRGELLTAVQSVAIPAARADGSNATQIANARRNRALIATFLVLVSPEFLVQK